MCMNGLCSILKVGGGGGEVEWLNNARRFVFGTIFDTLRMDNPSMAS